MLQNLLHGVLHLAYSGDMPDHTAVRKSVSLTPAALELVRQIRTPGSIQRDAIERELGALPASTSEAQAIAALISMGSAVLEARVLDAAYAAEAAAYTPEDRQFREAQRSRRDARHARTEGLPDSASSQASTKATSSRRSGRGR